uniref:large ribosomal subunit protein bL28m isoform X1 n=1 Tax=Myxine glutinosa TaxID=7769 RepID=UPI00358F4483
MPFLHKVPPRLWEVMKLRKDIYARLPEHYRRSLEPKVPKAVHWVPKEESLSLNPQTGQRERVQNVPIPVHYPPESQMGLWGGEGVIYGFKYTKHNKNRPLLRKSWKPQVFKRQLYSEILDFTFTASVTMRVLDLIDDAYGLDFYILKTPKEDLNSKLGMDLKRAMLLRLARKDTHMYPNEPEKGERIYNTYKEFVIAEEEAEWVGLSLVEAVEKQRQLEKKDPEPLFKVYMKELVEQLPENKLND